ncbi:Protein of unknown function DUF188 [hydrothermal vent metagenome]|uniref:Uncharacterized protein n=1 Tax=hydrothermal vent metagenome TaxID=652676 RepID=A0A1W1C7B6_9ZZZZ
MITLFIDGDALPNLLKPIILRSIKRLNLPTKVISNKKISIGKSPYIEYLIVDKGIDEADNHIVELAKKDDIVITSDIPLADRVVSLGAHAIDHRGTLYDKENIKSCLAIRNLMQNIRESGEITKGPPPFDKKDVHNFATTFNNLLAKAVK